MQSGRTTSPDSFSTARMEQMLRLYKRKWQFRPVADIEREVDDKCRGLHSWDSGEKQSLCTAITDIFTKIRTENAREYYLQSDCKNLIAKRAMACSPDDLGYTNDEFTCDLITQTLQEKGCKM